MKVLSKLVMVVPFFGVAMFLSWVAITGNTGLLPGAMQVPVAIYLLPYAAVGFWLVAIGTSGRMYGWVLRLGLKSPDAFGQLMLVLACIVLGVGAAFAWAQGYPTAMYLLVGAVPATVMVGWQIPGTERSYRRLVAAIARHDALNEESEKLRARTREILAEADDYLRDEDGDKPTSPTV